MQKYVAFLILGVAGIIMLRAVDLFSIEDRIVVNGTEEPTKQAIFSYLLFQWFGYFSVGLTIGYYIYQAFPFDSLIEYSLFYMAVLCLPLLSAIGVPFLAWAYLLLPILDYVLWKHGSWQAALLLTIVSLALAQVLFSGNLKEWIYPWQWHWRWLFLS